MRLDGTNDVKGREILEAAALPNVYAAKTMDEAAEQWSPQLASKES